MTLATAESCSAAAVSAAALLLPSRHSKSAYNSPYLMVILKLSSSKSSFWLIIDLSLITQRCSKLVNFWCCISLIFMVLTRLQKCLKLVKSLKILFY